ncbi:MAG TPA: HAD family hydrolase [Jiangellaceae bacterium]
MTPSAVLLDLDGTLVDTPSTMRNVVVQAMEDMVGELPEAVRGAIVDRWIADPARHFCRYEIGEITFADQRRARFAEVAAMAGAPTDEVHYAAWEAAYEKRHGAGVRPYDDVMTFLDRLRLIPIAVVTNVRTEFQRTKLASAGLAERLPGDSLVADVEGALAAGPEAIWLDRAGNGHSGRLPLGANRVGH